jgi:hypothetical protein
VLRSKGWSRYRSVNAAEHSLSERSMPYPGRGLEWTTASRDGQQLTLTPVAGLCA